MPGSTRATLRRRIERDDAVQVFRKIHDDRNVAALAREARSCAARQDWRTGFAARPYRCGDVRLVERDDQPDGDLTIVGRVGRIERPGAVIEAHFTPDGLPELLLERLAATKRFPRMRVGAGLGFKRHSHRPSSIVRSSFVHRPVQTDRRSTIDALLLPDRFDRLEARLPDIGHGVGRGTGMPFKFAGLDVHAVGRASRPLDGDDSRRARQSGCPSAEACSGQSTDPARE